MSVGNHFEGGDGTLDAFVAVFSAGTVEGLLHGVGGQDTEDDGTFVFKSHVGDALRHSLADELEVACFALDNASDADDGVGILVAEHHVGCRGELECAGHMAYQDVFFFYAVFT